MSTPADRRPHLVERLQQARAEEARSHLVERAVEAMGAVPPPAEALVTPPAPGAAPAAPAPPPGPAAVTLARLAAAGLVAPAERAARARVLEEIAVVQTQLLRAVPKTPLQDGRAGNLIMFTSARPGEGKTFCSLNIAAGLARASTRPVLLVDADGKQGSLSMSLGLTDAPGLMTLSGDQALAPARPIVPTEVPRLSVLPYGSAASREGQPPGPRLAAALVRLAAAMPQHVIVVDTPPCLAASDPSAIAPVVGQVVMVVQAERTERREVEAALDLVEACPVIHLLLNQTHLTVSDSFGAYGGYDGYGGGNGDS
jgi:receptor protein-tyrosine kinase